MKRKKTKLEKERGIVERKKTVGHDPITGKAIRKSFYGSGRHALEQIDEKYHVYMSRNAEVSESAETLAAVCDRWAESVSRTRGGDPNPADILGGYMECFPHTRG
jgi:hypothetical protein